MAAKSGLRTKSFQDEKNWGSLQLYKLQFIDGREKNQ
jgi:hypothetical protein